MKTTLIAGAAAAACLFAPALAQAQAAWPNQPIRIILPVAPGGTADAAMRLIQEPLGKLLGQPVIVDNRPGGNATIATSAVVRSAPDGHTLGLVSTPFTANPALMAKVPYDTRKDVAPVAFFWESPLAWSVHPDAPYKTLADVVNASKADPGKVSYAVGGIGQGSHFSIAALEQAAGIRMTVIGYKGAGPALNDVLAKQVPMLVSTVGVAAPHVQGGKLRVLAVTSAERVTQWPSVPTAKELGYPGLVTGEWFGFVGPAGLPDDIARRFNEALAKVMREPQVHARMAQLDLNFKAMTPAEFGRYLHQQIDSIDQLVKVSGIKLE